MGVNWFKLINYGAVIENFKSMDVVASKSSLGSSAGWLAGWFAGSSRDYYWTINYLQTILLSYT